jgi:putative endonuclease
MLYTGMAQDLDRRLQEHKNASHLVEFLYKEEYPDKFQAARRERQIKGWTRKKKLALIDGDLELLRRLSRSPSDT